MLTVGRLELTSVIYYTKRRRGVTGYVPFSFLFDRCVAVALVASSLLP